MRFGVLIMVIICFQWGCTIVNSGPPEAITAQNTYTGPPVRKFCVTGPGFQNENCLRSATAIK